VCRVVDLPLQMMASGQAEVMAAETLSYVMEFESEQKSRSEALLQHAQRVSTERNALGYAMHLYQAANRIIHYQCTVTKHEAEDDVLRFKNTLVLCHPTIDVSDGCSTASIRSHVMHLVDAGLAGRDASVSGSNTEVRAAPLKSVRLELDGAGQEDDDDFQLDDYFNSS